MTNEIATNILNIRQRIATAAIRAGRDPGEIKLMAVSKTIEPERIRQALAAGITLLGENYVQEARDKIPAIDDKVQWHMIGHLQTNKVKYVVNLFDWIHSVDRMELARELDKRAGQNSRRLNVLIEVNVSGEESKSGVEPEQVMELIRQTAALPSLSVRGLMTMPPYSDDPENSRPYFKTLRQLQNEIIALEIHGIALTELSMGMTDDFEVAIEEGATIIRVGRAIFGERIHR